MPTRPKVAMAQFASVNSWKARKLELRRQLHTRSRRAPTKGSDFCGSCHASRADQAARLPWGTDASANRAQEGGSSRSANGRPRKHPEPRVRHGRTDGSRQCSPPPNLEVKCTRSAQRARKGFSGRVTPVQVIWPIVAIAVPRVCKVARLRRSSISVSGRARCLAGRIAAPSR